MIPEMLIPSVPIPIEGINLTLRADFHALIHLEKTMGVSFLDSEAWLVAVSARRMKPIISLMHSLSRTHNPEVTTRDIGKMLNLQTLPTFANCLKQVMNDQMIPEREELGDPQEPLVVTADA